MGPPGWDWVDNVRILAVITMAICLVAAPVSCSMIDSEHGAASARAAFSGEKPPPADYTAAWRCFCLAVTAGFAAILAEILRALREINGLLGLMNAKLIDAWWQAVTGPPGNRAQTPQSPPNSVPPPIIAVPRR
jgi:hypothetical protein